MNLLEMEYYQTKKEDTKILLNNILSYLSDTLASIDSQIEITEKLDKEKVRDWTSQIMNDVKLYCKNINEDNGVLNPNDNNWIK